MSSLTATITVYLQKIRGAMKDAQGNPSALAKIFRNLGWLSFNKLLKTVLGLFVGILLARHLGPEGFGLLNYALSLVALFGVFSVLGLDTVAVREIARDRERASDILTATLLMRVAASTFSVICISATVIFLPSDEPLAQTVVLLLSFSLFFKSGDVVKYWFEAEVESRYTVWIESAVFSSSGLAKIVFIFCDGSLLSFVYLILIESFLTASAFIYLLMKKGRFFKLTGNLRKTATRLFRDSWPLIFAGLAAMIYMRIDMIMLDAMIGSGEVGIYAAATKISEAWYFLPMILTATLSPYIMRTYQTNPSAFLDILKAVYFGLAWLALIIALVLTVYSDSLVGLIYGSAYSESAPILSIHLWACIPAFLGVASSQYLLAKNMQKAALYRTLLGAATNIILNLTLIPRFGASGAAVATIVSYFISVFSLFLFPRTRSHAKTLLLSPFAFRDIYRLIKQPIS